MPTQFYGIRHHGAGSARHLLHALNRQQPDLILLEAPPEAQPLLPLVAHTQMRPPVAWLAYRADAPQQAVYYPFAVYSPEWQAIQYALRNQIPIQFFDLPLAYSLAKQSEESLNTNDDEPAGSLKEPSEQSAMIARDPFDYLAEIAGFSDGEVFWEHLVEHRADSHDVFAAVEIAVAALREHEPIREHDLLREAYMRKILRQSEKEANNIAVVCGAWHVPALTGKYAAKDDNQLLKNLPKCKVDCTFIPWTNNRLTFDSGYGAGVNAPAWYGHLWQHADDDGVLWLGRAAVLLREKGFDISAAYVIETLRLANASAALRGQHRPYLADFIDAVVAVMGMGDGAIVDLIGEHWLIGHDIGAVPDETPQLPLIADVAQQRKKCRLPETATQKVLELDLRKPLDLQRSILIHRVKLLDIHWADSQHSNSKGTFKETWLMTYQPEHHIELIERAVHGNTLQSAVVGYVCNKMRETSKLGELTEILKMVLPADLPDLMENISLKISHLSAHHHDLHDTLMALPNLVEVLRYGSVRDFDTAPLRQVLHTLLVRVAAGGVQGCLNIDTDTAQSLFQPIREADYAVNLLEDEALTQLWCEFLTNQVTALNVHPLLAGNAVHLLFDKQIFHNEQVAQLFSQNLSTEQSHAHAASWLEGFLYRSGTILLLHDDLWTIIDDWLRGLSDDLFIELLPLLRRTFGSFEFGEKRQLGEKAAAQTANHQPTSRPMQAAAPDAAINVPLAEHASKTVQLLLGLTTQAA